MIEVADFLVLSVRREGVLDQIVGPDAEEVALAGEVIDRQRRARGLDHRPHGGQRIMRSSLQSQLRAALEAQVSRWGQLRHPGDQWKEDTYGADSGGTVERTELGTKDVWPGE